MLMAAGLSDLNAKQQLRLRSLVETAGLPTEPPPLGSEQLRRAMNLDKKAAAGTLRFVLLRALGTAYITADYSETLLAEILSLADA